MIITNDMSGMDSNLAKKNQLLVYSYIVKAIQKLTKLNCSPVMDKIQTYYKYAETDDINFYSTVGGNMTVDDVNFNVGISCYVEVPERKPVLTESEKAKAQETVKK